MFKIVYPVLLAGLLLSLLAVGVSAQSQIYKLVSPFIDDFGRSLALVNDADGDGRRDILAGAPARRESAASQPGAAVLYSAATGLVLRTHWGGTHGEYFGLSLAAAGDIDGDGVEEYAVGAPEADYYYSNGGSIYFFSGASGTQIRRIDADASGKYLGLGICALGDVTGDGVPDLAGSSIATTAQPGFVRVYSGATGGVVYTLIPPWPPNGQGGARLARIGDVDGDGIDELAIGSPWANGNQGDVRLVSGANGGLIRVFTPAASEFGTSVVDAGDLDLDGLPDVFVGSPWEGPTGMAKVFSSGSGAVLQAFSGDGPSQRFGQSLAKLSDLDGDGVQEFAVAAIWAPYTGSNAGRVRVFSGQSGAPLYTFDGDHGGADLGSALISAGDVDGDGVGDLAAGQPKGPYYSVKLFSGTCVASGVFTYCTGKPNSVGSGASIGWTGSPSISASNFRLTVTGCPPSKSGIFLFSFEDQTAYPFGNGLLCATGQFIRRILPALVTSPGGTAGLNLNFAVYPTDFLPGANPKFQFWYRDPAGGGQGFNLSDALSVSFCP